MTRWLWLTLAFVVGLAAVPFDLGAALARKLRHLFRVYSYPTDDMHNPPDTRVNRYTGRVQHWRDGGWK